MYKFENISKFYDMFEKGLKRDKKFYLEEAKKAKGKVLEIAVGTGRIFLPMLQNGIDAYGIDVSKSMIEVLEEKAKKKEIDLKGRVTKQDMQKFKLNIEKRRQSDFEFFYSLHTGNH
jgi:ubiquinone/menaquinone biosynthesis C-methylase UbiE